MAIDKITELFYKASLNNKKLLEEIVMTALKTCRLNGVIHRMKPDQNL